MNPTELWLAGAPLREMRGQFGTFHGRRGARVEFRDGGRVVACGKGETLDEACAKAIDMLQAQMGAEEEVA